MKTSIEIPGLKNTIGTSNYVQVEKTRDPLLSYILPELDNNNTPLTKKETDIALKKLFDDSFLKLSYPKDQRLRVDKPISEQEISLVSCIVSPWAQPDKNGVYGILRLRGGYMTDKEANDKGINLLKYNNSYIPIEQGISGRLLPLCMDDRYSKELKTIDVKRATFEEEENKKQEKIEEEANNRETEQQQREERELDNEENFETNPTEETKNLVFSDYYGHRFRYAQVKEYEDGGIKARSKAYPTIQSLEAENPDHIDNCIPTYLKKLEEIGVMPDRADLLKDLVKYDVIRDMLKNKELEYKISIVEIEEQTDNSRKRHQLDQTQSLTEKVKYADYPEFTEEELKKINDRVNKVINEKYIKKEETGYRTQPFPKIKSELIKYKMNTERPFTRRTDEDAAFCNYRFYLSSFVKAQDAKEDYDSCIGVIQYRGGYETVEKAKNAAKAIITSADSSKKIYAIYTGKEYPIANDEFWKKPESEIKDIVNEIMKIHVRDARNNEKKEQEESMKKKENGEFDEIKAGRDDPTSIHNYIKLRVGFAGAEKYIRESRMAAAKFEKKIMEKEKKYDWLIEDFNQKMVQVEKEKPVPEDKKKGALYKYLTKGILMIKEVKIKEEEPEIEFED